MTVQACPVLACIVLWSALAAPITFKYDIYKLRKQLYNIVNMATALDPNQLHAQGLEASLSGRFGDAELLFTQARNGFIENGTDIDVGRVDRDLARVYAGLGEPALRNAVIERAFEIHWDEFTRDADNTTHAASELAATQHVRARIDLANGVENGSFRAPKMAREWDEAYKLLNMFDMNEDYMQQVLAHGSLALATFGRRGDLPLATKLAKDPIAEFMTSNKRRQAVKTAGYILHVRQIFIPVAAIPQVRDRVAGMVAGPYLTKG